MLPSPPGPPASSHIRWRRIWAASLAGATALVVITTSQTYGSLLVEGYQPVLWKLFRTEAIMWYTWAILAPAVFLIGPRLTAGRYPRGRLLAAWFAWGLALAAVHTVMEVVPIRALGWAGTSVSFTTMLVARFISTTAASVFVVTLIVLVYYALEQQQERRARELREASLEGELARSRLKVLEMQLHPHFFFNALHTVSALMNEDVSAARRVLTRLGDLLRQSLERSDAHEVPLRDELAFVEKYLDIQRIRFRDRLTVRIDVAESVLDAAVPALLLQPLVENAIRHAVEPRTAPSTVVIQGMKRDDRLVVEVRDDGSGGTPSAGTGKGLANVRRRLAQLHGNDHAFTLSPGPAGGTVARVEMPYRRLEAGEFTT